MEVLGKDSTLKDTILRFENFFKMINLKIEVVSWLNPVSYVHSVHIRARDVPYLFTNGKGNSKEASLASAYGEFIERLLTLYFFADFDFESLVVIVSLDHLNQAEYLEYKGSDYFEQVIGSIKELLTLKTRNSFIQVLNMEGLSDKLDKFYELEFNDFIKEIEKQSKKKLSLKEQDEWEDYFKDYKKELQKLKDEIEKTDNEINQMVYKLYGLSKEDITVVEGSLK